MALHWKLVVDATDPHLVADYWAAALGYQVEDNSRLIDSLLKSQTIDESLITEHHGRRAWKTLIAVRHPDDAYDPDTGAGLGRRILFQQVPEAKTVKNRLHIDIHPDPGTRAAEVARLIDLGGTMVREVQEPGGEWTVLADPEGNEFCVS